MSTIVTLPDGHIFKKSEIIGFGPVNLQKPDPNYMTNPAPPYTVEAKVHVYISSGKDFVVILHSEDFQDLNDLTATEERRILSAGKKRLQSLVTALRP